MNHELEALLKAYDAFMQARGGEAQTHLAAYEAGLEARLARQPGLARETLHRAVQLAYRRWVKAQNTPPSLPPKA